MPDYVVNITDIAQRQQLIAERTANPIREEMFYEHLTAGETLPVISLGLDVPVYRMANYRTTTYQKGYVRHNSKNADFFSAGQEDVEAQRIQHSILDSLARQGSGTTIRAIFEVLSEMHRQQMPLLVTQEGVIVNGNRRLCAMRELYQSNPTRYQAFEQVQVMVLGPLAEDDIRLIEVGLQMAQETRLPYDWANFAWAVRDMSQKGHSRAQISARMRLDRERDVDAIITRINEAEIYLDEFLGTPEEYDQLGQREQLFMELQKALDSKTDPHEKDVARKLCHVLSKHRGDIDARTYNYRMAFGSQTTEVAELLGERWGIDLPVIEVEQDEDDDLFEDTDDGRVRKDYSALITRLSDQDTSEANAQEIKAVCDELNEQRNEANRGTRALRKLQDAKNAIGRVDLEAADPSTFGEIQAALEDIGDATTELINQLHELQGGDGA